MKNEERYNNVLQLVPIVKLKASTEKIIKILIMNSIIRNHIALLPIHCYYPDEERIVIISWKLAALNFFFFFSSLTDWSSASVINCEIRL